MKLQKILSIAFIFFTSVIALIVISILILQLMGYSLNGVGWEVAEKAAVQKNVNLCNKIWVVFNPLGLSPGTASQRADCIHEYAKLTKDPSACELLMPSSYGLSCVGEAEDHKLPCGTEKYKVYWGENDKPHEADLLECIRPNSGMSELGKQCCTVARNRYLLDENDCSSLKINTPVYDQCLYGLAWKLKDPDLCINITNENAKAACLVQSKALREDPSICSGCTQAVENIEDLK